MDIIKKLRNRILEVALRDGMGHIPSALSILDIVWVLHEKVMIPSDQFILSKGHGCMALYAVLEEQGRLDWSKKLWGHPKRDGKFILASTGSLGHGLPMAVGLALAKKIKGEKGRVFCLIGDGECNEGSIWESALLAAHHKLNNLTIIIDQNHSSDRAVNMGSLYDKFRAFGCVVSEQNGHNLDIIESVLNCFGSGAPFVFISRNVKGHGIPFMENNPSWHNKQLTKEDYNKAIQ